MAGTLLGIDLSATATAAVSAPLDWDGDWRRVRSVVAGERLRRDASDLERARRCETIAARIVRFAQSEGAETAWVESYAYNQRTAAHVLAEVGGVVRLELVRAGIDVRTAPMTTARKMLLGKLPRRDVKAHVQSALLAAGAPASWSGDECDAFVAAQYGLSELGGFFFGQVA